MRNLRRSRNSLLALAALAAAVPPSASGDDVAGELVAEAFFLLDTLPPTGRELSIALASTAGASGDPDVASARLQGAFALGDELGIVVSAGVAREATAGAGATLDAPALSLKWLFQAPSARSAGLSASLDVLGAPGEPGGLELVAGLGALRQLGAVTARAALGLASTAGALDAHVHAGGSLAVAPLPRVRLLAEAIGEWGEASEDRSFAIGPTVKYALAADVSLAVSALVAVAPEVRPLSFMVQVARGL